jgi:flagellar hook assembly protein FlgD
VPIVAAVVCGVLARGEAGILHAGLGAQRASVAGDRSLSTRAVTTFVIALLCALAAQLAPGSIGARPVRADTVRVPKAVFIVGPTGSLTDDNLADAEKMAQQAEAVGMEVHRVFFPHATWDNVLANIQDANLVVYMGHGYGWPSPYTATLTESRQDGMGLNSYDGSGRNAHTYYGATRLRESVRLAPNAIVYLNHLCYASGNAEPGMAIPGANLARERVDNMASGWLAIGARAVFAYGWWQRLNLPNALMNSDQTIDQMFMTRPSGAYAGSPAGYTAWNEARFDSLRTPGSTIHLDPHQKYGYYRAVTGDLNMTAADFRSSATGTQGGSNDVTAPPQITALSAASSTTGTALSAGVVSFHPNGDGIDDSLLLKHTVSRAAYLDATVKDSRGQTVRSYSVWSTKGTATSTWNGKNAAGTIVPDGRYTLTYVPRDSTGAMGNPVSLDALVLTAVKLGTPSAPALFARDADALSKTVKVAVTVNKSAQVGFQVFDDSGNRVRTVRAVSAAAAGTLSFVWDGKADGGSWAKDGWYRSVVTATTDLGTYSQERRFYAGAFRIAPSIKSPARGGQLTLTVTSTEALSKAPIVHVSQPGLAVWDARTTLVSGKKYKVTLTLKSGGTAGTLNLVVAGVDKYGGSQQTGLSLPLR